MGGYVGDEQEEETLSLCDLPVNEKDTDPDKNETRSLELEDFEFGSCGGSILTEQQMCVADDVFFQGQILPLRISVSSAREESSNPSRSESMEHNLTSSRSSSCRSDHISSNTITTTTYKPKLHNQFHSHSHPSPKPQVWVSGSRPRSSTRVRKSNVWGLFRVGLVKTPEMELQELKKKSFNSRSSSSGSSCSKNSKENNNNNNGLKSEKKKKKAQRLFDSCKCDAVEIVPEKVVLITKTRKSASNKNGNEDKEEKEKKQRKQALHQRRTFEWLKELSIADLPVVDEV